MAGRLMMDAQHWAVRSLLQTAGDVVTPETPSVEEDACAAEIEESCIDTPLAQKWAIAAIFLILAGSTVGALLPLLSRRVKWLNVGGFAFTAGRCFGGGVMVALGLIHMYPEGIEALASECLGWGDFPWGATLTTAAVIIVAILEFVGGQLLYNWSRRKQQASEAAAAQEATVERADGSFNSESLEKGAVMSADDRLWAHTRAMATAQVLEYGIAAHSVLVGLALGVSSSPCTIRPLAAALVFHQMFEGFALGATLIGAGIYGWAYMLMVGLFAVTTPAGIALGIGIRNTYNENSSTALAVNGVLEAVSAGILIYTGLVDLVAADLFSPNMRTKKPLFQAGVLTALFLGAFAMAVIAKWA